MGDFDRILADLFGSIFRHEQFRPGRRNEDDDGESWKLKLLAYGIGFFLFTGCISCTEFDYYRHGRIAIATASSHMDIGPKCRQYNFLDYQFVDADGNLRKNSVLADRSWPVGQSGKVEVEYLPGASGSSRLARHRNWGCLVVFGTSIVLAVVGSIWFWVVMYRAANHTRPRRRGRRGATKSERT
jgi:hypothetical protein